MEKTGRSSLFFSFSEVWGWKGHLQGRKERTSLSACTVHQKGKDYLGKRRESDARLQHLPGQQPWFEYQNSMNSRFRWSAFRRFSAMRVMILTTSCRIPCNL